MKNILRFCLFPLLLCFCVSSKSNEDSIPTMEFSVSDSLLQKPVTDKELGISFRPPVGWNALSNNSLEQKINAMLSDKALSRERAYIFHDKQLTAFLVLNNAPYFNADNGKMSIQKVEEKYHKQFPQSEINTCIFKKDVFRVHQIVVNLGKIVLVRLFFDTEKRPAFEASFIFPAESYQERMKTVESVVGSIHSVGKR